MQIEYSASYCDNGDVLLSVQSVDLLNSNHTGNIKYVDQIILIKNLLLGYKNFTYSFPYYYDSSALTCLQLEWQFVTVSGSSSFKRLLSNMNL